MIQSTVSIVHGYTSSSKAEWFPWLKGKLLDMGINVIVFDMPNSDAPIVAEWDAYLDENIKICNENTYFVGHSLGCVTLLRYFTRQPADTKIGGVILASGFVKQNPRYPNLDAFVVGDYLDMEKITHMTNHRYVVSAPNDNYVPYIYSCELAELFDAKLITVENGGHFIGQEGFFEFPQVYDELCRMIDKK